MRCKNFLKVHKNTCKKMFAEYLSTDGCFVKTIILLTVVITTMLFPGTREFAFTRQPMKRNFTWSIRAIHLRSSSAFLSRLKFWTCVMPRQKRAFANYRDHAKILVVFKRWCNCLILCESCCSQNWPTFRGEKQANNN